MIGVARLVVSALFCSALAVDAFGGPVDLYLEGPQLCPRDRPQHLPRLTEAQAKVRASTMLPQDFCGPSAFVTGCDYDAENEYDSWRIYVHQFNDRAGRKQHAGLQHTYLILDPVGNCLAHIPGTEFGALK